MRGIATKYESLDYDTCENRLLVKEEKQRGYSYVLRKNFTRWLTFFMIGALTACIGATVEICIDELITLKFSLVRKYMVPGCKGDSCKGLYVPLLLWAALNIAIVVTGALMVVYIEPMSGGSGVSWVKAYLNGICIDKVVRLKTLVVRVVGVVLSVAGGLAVGKEGPMIHAGAIVGAGVSQGHSPTCKQDLHIMYYFREDRVKRDFVAGGAGAGVAGAFGAPIGGVLFALEETASFWNQVQTLRTFFCTAVASFTLNSLMSAYHGHFGDMTNDRLLNFGKFPDTCYNFFELPFFCLMGVVGGVWGALFNCLSYHLTVLRARVHGARKWSKVVEAGAMAALSAGLGFLMIQTVDPGGCRNQVGAYVVPNNSLQMRCGPDEFNVVSSLWFQSFQGSTRGLFHEPVGTHSAPALATFCVLFFVLSTLCNGLSVSLGLFIPTMLLGAAWGRLAGIGLTYAFPDQEWTFPGKYAVLGAAAHMSGVMRMTLAITVIMIETTGNTTSGVPIMLTVFVAKWVGDFCYHDGIYEVLLNFANVPVLPWDPPPMTTHITADQFMHSPVVTLAIVESVGNIVDVLTNTKHNGFPIRSQVGTFQGLILRSQLITLIQQEIFVETAARWNMEQVTMEMFRHYYPRYPKIEDIPIPDAVRSFTIDLEPFLSRSTYAVQATASLPRVFRLFRGLGLRHLVVVDERNKVMGIVSRVDLARYHQWYRLCKTGLTILPTVG